MTAVAPIADAPIRPGLDSAETWEYLVVPLQEAKGLKKADDPWSPDQLNELGRLGWEAIGLSLTHSDLIASPVVLLKRALH